MRNAPARSRSPPRHGRPRVDCGRGDRSAQVRSSRTVAQMATELIMMAMLLLLLLLMMTMMLLLLIEDA